MEAPPTNRQTLSLGLIAAGALLAAFVAVTGWALESGGVAIVRTGPAGDDRRATHVWYAETNGEIWLEAGTPENGWFVDLQTDPELTLEIDGRRQRWRAVPIDAPSGHPRIRALMREKYGFRDWWVGLLVDTSRSVAVRLTPGTRAGPDRARRLFSRNAPPRTLRAGPRGTWPGSFMQLVARAPTALMTGSG
jgi:hypothetical protein